MKKRKIVYTNLNRKQLKYEIAYNLLRYSPILLLFFTMMIFFQPDMMNILIICFLTVLMIYRVKRFDYWHDLMNVIEMEISPDEICLVTTTEDYHIHMDEIKAVALKQNPSNPENLDIYLQTQEYADLEWPIGLKEKDYIRIPMIFEDHSLDIMDEWEELKAKCKNYKMISSSIERERTKKFN